MGIYFKHGQYQNKFNATYESKVKDLDSEEAVIAGFKEAAIQTLTHLIEQRGGAPLQSISGRRSILKKTIQLFAFNSIENLVKILTLFKKDPISMPSLGAALEDEIKKVGGESKMLLTAIKEKYDEINHPHFLHSLAVKISVKQERLPDYPIETAESICNCLTSLEHASQALTALGPPRVEELLYQVGAFIINKDKVLFKKYKDLAAEKPPILAITKQILFIMACAMKALPPDVVSQFQKKINEINLQVLREGVAAYRAVIFPNGCRFDSPPSSSVLKAILEKSNKCQDIPADIEKTYKVTDFVDALERVQPLNMHDFHTTFSHDSAAVYRQSLSNMELTQGKPEEKESETLRSR